MAYILMLAWIMTLVLWIIPMLDANNNAPHFAPWPSQAVMQLHMEEMVALWCQVWQEQAHDTNTGANTELCYFTYPEPSSLQHCTVCM